MMYKDISFAIVLHSILGPHLGRIDRGIRLIKVLELKAAWTVQS